MALLEVEGLEASYGSIKALHGVDFELEDGSVTAILGANGAGKTTTLRALCGMVTVAGRISLDGTDIAGTSIEIANNTFRAPQTPVVIRGVPQEKCKVHHNWFPKHGSAGRAVRAAAKTEVSNNVYGQEPKAAK